MLVSTFRSLSLFSYLGNDSKLWIFPALYKIIKPIYLKWNYCLSFRRPCTGHSFSVIAVLPLDTINMFTAEIHMMKTVMLEHELPNRSWEFVSLLHLWINSAKISSTVLKGLGVLLNTVAYGSTNCKLCNTYIQILVLIGTPS